MLLFPLGYPDIPDLPDLPDLPELPDLSDPESPRIDRQEDGDPMSGTIYREGLGGKRVRPVCEVDLLPIFPEMPDSLGKTSLLPAGERRKRRRVSGPQTHTAQLPEPPLTGTRNLRPSTLSQSSRNTAPDAADSRRNSGGMYGRTKGKDGTPVRVHPRCVPTAEAAQSDQLLLMCKTPERSAPGVCSSTGTPLRGFPLHGFFSSTNAGRPEFDSPLRSRFLNLSSGTHSDTLTMYLDGSKIQPPPTAAKKRHAAKTFNNRSADEFVCTVETLENKSSREHICEHNHLLAHELFRWLGRLLWSQFLASSDKENQEMITGLIQQSFPHLDADIITSILNCATSTYAKHHNDMRGFIDCFAESSIMKFNLVIASKETNTCMMFFENIVYKALSEKQAVTVEVKYSWQEIHDDARLLTSLSYKITATGGKNPGRAFILSGNFNNPLSTMQPNTAMKKFIDLQVDYARAQYPVHHEINPLDDALKESSQRALDAEFDGIAEYPEKATLTQSMLGMVEPPSILQSSCLGGVTDKMTSPRLLKR